MLFIAPLSPKSNVEDVYTKDSVCEVFALAATLKEGDEGGRGGTRGDEGGRGGTRGEENKEPSQHFCLWLYENWN